MRRIAVRFWRIGEDRPSLGHTVNLSPRGMFIGTNRPPKSGERVRVEVVAPDKGFVVEGVVTHSHLVAPELRRIQEAGMGVRLLSSDELIRSLVAVTPETSTPTAVPARPEPPAAGSADAPVTVRFESPEHFLNALRRDIQHGGLFVATPKPAPLDQLVALELKLEGDRGWVEKVVARVVHRYDPAEHPDEGRTGQSPGMGVEFVERDLVVARLRRRAQGLGERLGERPGG